jgi:hypothetical protein
MAEPAELRFDNQFPVCLLKQIHRSTDQYVRQQLR